MSLRTGFALAFALISAIVAGLVGVLSYHAASERITQEVDRTLSSATASVVEGQTGVLSASVAGSEVGNGPQNHDGGPGGARPLIGWAVAPDGTTTFLGGRQVPLPLSDTARALAASGTAGETDTAEFTVDHDAYRVLTTVLGSGRGAVEVAVDVDDSQRVLQEMAIQITWVSAVVLLVAAAVGWLLAWRITRRLVRLTAIAEDVSTDGGIEREVPVGGRDEVGRLSTSFNRMLNRLAAARAAQDRLVEDAAHELRTPLTSLRTNASVLRRVDELSPDARARLIDDVQGETRELSHLVDELVELALSQRGEEPDEPTDLTEVARHAADRIHRRTGRRVHIDSDGSIVHGRRSALERAVGNLLENAAKFDGGGQDPIEVRVRGGATTVTDQGPGIGATDAARVFDRFYRADAARSLPGSGLGLAIVRDVAESHGGTVTVSAPADGGAAVGFTVDHARLLPLPRPEHHGTPLRSITIGPS